MRILLTGAGGMLGRDLQSVLATSDHTVTALGRTELDVTDRDAVLAAVEGHDWIVNCAAYTAVDDAETDVETAHAVNASAAGYLAEASARHGARLVQISTDYVFDGTARQPYSESHPVSPLSVYGRTKADGERLVLDAAPDAIVLRTAWLYGEHGPNFVSAILRAAASRDIVSVLTDQRGQPTWTGDLAERIRLVIDRDLAGGIFHATNAGDASRFEFAQEIFRLAGLDPERIAPADPADHVRPAPRPDYSVLGHEAWATAGLEPMRGWRDALAASAISGWLTNSP
ncbi:MAG: dTDP-4-dehydrorhamnose reductase [Cryobacterium sp.]|nr:dTDP-4-dehydrorhamnose reductase [Cryobacterium sp.]